MPSCLTNLLSNLISRYSKTLKAPVFENNGPVMYAPIIFILKSQIKQLQILITLLWKNSMIP